MRIAHRVAGAFACPNVTERRRFLERGGQVLFTLAECGYELLAFGGKYARLCEQSLLETSTQPEQGTAQDIAILPIPAPDEQLSI